MAKKPNMDWNGAHQRLLSAIGARPNRQALADGSGLTKSTIDNILAGKSEPSFTKIARLCGHLGVRLNWVAFGDGPAFRRSNRRADDREYQPANFSALTAPPAADPTQPPENAADPSGQPAQRVCAAISPPIARRGLMRRLAGRIGAALTFYSTGASA